jgi:hypothetical protein
MVDYALAIYPRVMLQMRLLKLALEKYKSYEATRILWYRFCFVTFNGIMPFKNFK